MSPSLLALGFGGILILVGLIGGGFEVRELKIPKVGATVRVLSAIAGIFFVYLGLIWSPDIPDSVDQPVEFTLTDELGSGEVSEQVVILLDGKNIGNLTVDAAYPRTSINVVVPTSGFHTYTAESTAIFTEGGDTVTYTGAGQGQINVQNGKSYSVRGSITGDTWFVSIEEGDED